MTTAHDWITEHETEVVTGLAALREQADLVDRWGRALAEDLAGGARLLVAGNGGSAAEAQHLTAELVGRFLAERRPLSAIALCAETASLTAITNDYGADEMFARQVEAHGRRGDVLVLLSTSGSSPNVLRAAERGARMGLTVWGMTGAGPNPLTIRCHETLTVPAPTTAAVQAVHLVAIHAMCAIVDAQLAVIDARGPRRPARVGDPDGDVRRDLRDLRRATA